jgi:hypothetical protein
MMHVIIDGLLVPATLLEIVHQGRWTAPNRLSPVYREVFYDEAAQPEFLMPHRMRANRRWIDAILPEYREFYLGRPDATRPPGDIDPDQSLLIGDLGPDQPFSLDYRQSDHAPTVIYLSTTANWIEVAPDIATFIVQLGI